MEKQLKIAVLGLGAMGNRMALNLLMAGHEVTVWNRSLLAVEEARNAGANVADTCRKAVENADFVISMVRDDEASSRVWLSDDGALVGMSEHAIGIESSTCSLSWIRELSNTFAERQISFLDAPVVGSRMQAENSELIYLAGGDEEVFGKAEPLFMQLGSAAHYMGQAGAGMAMKLVVNALLGIQVTAMAELFSLSKTIGLDAHRMAEVLAQTPPCSIAGKTALGTIVAGNFEPAFPAELMHKDLEYFLSEVSNTAPLSNVVWQMFDRAVKSGFGGDNMTGIVRLYK